MINKLIKLATTLEVLEKEEAYCQVDDLIIKAAGKYDKNISIPPFGFLAIKWWDIANETRKKWEDSMELSKPVEEAIEEGSGMFGSSSRATELGEQVRYQFTEFKRMVNLALEFERLKFFPSSMSINDVKRMSMDEEAYSELLLISVDISIEDFMENIHKLPKSETKRYSFEEALSEMWNTAQTIRMISDQSWRYDIDETKYNEISKNRNIAWAIHNLVKSMGPPRLFV